MILTPGNFEAEGGLKFRAEKDRSYAGPYPAEFRLAAGDLIVVMTDLTQEARILGAAAFVPDTITCLHNQRLGKIANLDAGRLDRRFAYYVFNSRGFREAVKATASGSTVKHTAPGRICAYSFRLPPLPIQRRIASILGAYDDLIEVNRRRIAVLEEMARRLFDEWFVHFRFPGHEGHEMVESENGRVPEGWQQGVLGDLIRLAYGKALKADTRVVGDVPVIGSSGIVGWHNQALIEGPAIILGRKGNVGAVIWSDTPSFPIDTVFFVETQRPLRFVHQQLKRLTFLNSDAAVPGLNRGGAMQMKITLPPVEMMNTFQRSVDAMLRQATTLSRTNARLATSRDLLLPRLISGDLSVAAAEAELETAA